MLFSCKEKHHIALGKVYMYVPNEIKETQFNIIGKWGLDTVGTLENNYWYIERKPTGAKFR